MQNKFISVTNSGIIYDKTNGKNTRLQMDTLYQVGNDTVQFRHNDDKGICVRRFNANGLKMFETEFKEVGNYIISKLFIQLLPKTSNDVKILYNKLKETVGKTYFKFENDTSMKQPYSIHLHTWLDKGFKYRFIIKMNEAAIHTKEIDDIYSIITQATKLDFAALLEYYNAFNENGLYVKLDREYIALAKYIEKTIAHKLLTT